MAKSMAAAQREFPSSTLFTWQALVLRVTFKSHLFPHHATVSFPLHVSAADRGPCRFSPRGSAECACFLCERQHHCVFIFTVDGAASEANLYDVLRSCNRDSCELFVSFSFTSSVISWFEIHRYRLEWISCFLGRDVDRCAWFNHLSGSDSWSLFDPVVLRFRASNKVLYWMQKTKLQVRFHQIGKSSPIYIVFGLV